MSTNGGFKGGLGRGLSSLIPNRSFGVVQQPTARPDAARDDVQEEVRRVNPDDIIANPYQPRSVFEEEKLKELGDSIREHGIINPLVVVARTDGRYELIAGERRLRAARDSGLQSVPVIVRSADPKAQLELSLIENIQREDLNPLERAAGYERLIQEFGLTQEEAAKRVGKPRSVVANTVRLLRLPHEIQESLRAGEINEGHAKVILSVPDAPGQIQLWKKITSGVLPVRAAEKEARTIAVKPHTRRGSALDPNLKALQEALEAHLGTRVVIKGTPDRGQVLVEYFSREELDRMRRQWFDSGLSP